MLSTGVGEGLIFCQMPNISAYSGLSKSSRTTLHLFAIACQGWDGDHSRGFVPVLSMHATVISVDPIADAPIITIVKELLRR